MPTEPDRSRAYETLAVANTSAPLDPDQVGYIELVSSPDPRVAPMVFALEHVRVRVGRFSSAGMYATSSDVYAAVADDAVAISPMNTMFEYVGGQFHAFDTRSRNGTFVNGEQISKRRLVAVGDVIDIGGAPADGGARFVFLGATPPPGRPIRRAPTLTRHEYRSPRGGLVLEIDSATGRGVARLQLQGEDWRAAALDAAARVSRVASPGLPASTIGEIVTYQAGEPLEPVVARRLLTDRDACAIVADLCEAVAACHAVQPAVLVGPFDRRLVFRRSSGGAVVFGAGIVRVAHKHDSGMTGPTMLPLHYLRSPEELRARDIGPASDVWHAAAFLIQLVTGREPFPTDDPIAYSIAVMRGEALLPAGTSSVIARALAADPQARPTLAALGAALRG